MTELGIKWEDNKPEPFEEETKKEKEEEAQKINEEEDKKQSEAEAPEEKEEEDKKGIAILLDTFYSLITKNKKGFKPLTQSEKDYLIEHSQEFDKKYEGKLKVVNSPEAELGFAILNVFGGKLFDYYKDKNTRDEVVNNGGTKP